MKNSFLKKFSTILAPLLGAGGIGACTISCVGSASLLTFLGLGAIMPFWSGLSLGFILLGTIGFIIDYSTHRKTWPLILLVFGGIIFYFGRYIFNAEVSPDWLVWGLGTILIVISTFYNRLLLSKKDYHNIYERRR